MHHTLLRNFNNLTVNGNAIKKIPKAASSIELP
jgi:hypothetical protein